MQPARHNGFLDTWQDRSAYTMAFCRYRLEASLSHSSVRHASWGVDVPDRITLHIISFGFVFSTNILSITSTSDAALLTC